MPLLPRIDALGVIHHVIIRGIEGRDILQDQSVYEDLLQRLESLIPETQTRYFSDRAGAYAFHDAGRSAYAARRGERVACEKLNLTAAAS